MADAVDEALEEIKAGKARPFYLVHGEEFLARRAAETICDALVPADKRDLNFSQIDGAAGGREVAQHIDTVPMFRGTKVVFVEAADVLLAKRDLEKELARSKELWGQSSRKKDAARRLLSIVAPAGWTYRELNPDGPDAPTKVRWKKEVGLEPAAEDREFIAEVAKYAADLELKAPKDDDVALLRSVTGGPPKGNHLVLLCEEFDPKHPVAKAIAERGFVIKRGVDRTGKGFGIASLDITAIAKEVLGPMGKTISREAATLLKDRVGEAMRQMSSELEKLAIYIGDRKQIEERDVDILVAPLREEEFFELGNAIGDGDASKALKLIEDELFRGKHPIMLLGGVTGSIRRLAIDAARFAKIPGALEGREFRASDMASYEALVTGGKTPTLWGVQNNFKRVKRHGARRLLRALALCAEVDAGMKRGAAGPMALERLILAICGIRPA